MTSPIEHLAIIPDGNRRWARKNGKRPFEGHFAGAEKAGKIFEEVLTLDIPYLTFWGASVSNLTNRSKIEVEVLYRVFAEYFKKLLERRELDEEEVRVRVLGRWHELLPKPAIDAIETVIEKTKSYNRRNLTVLIGYNGMDDMIQATTKIREGSGDVSKEELKSALWTAELPPVDLVIRTGGEPHWSQGFMMWDVAEARLHFTKTLWPAFTKEELREIVENYQNTERRFGA